MLNFIAKREIREYTFKVQSKKEDLFLLFCPQRELEWLEGWTYEMVFSSTGFAEQDCVFRTDNPIEGPSIWLVTQYQAPQKIEYVRVSPRSLVIRMSIELSETGKDFTEVKVTCSFTGLTETGNRCIDGYVSEHYPIRMKIWQQSLEQYFLRVKHKQ